MAEFVEVAQLDQLLPGASTTITIANREIALFNVDGAVYAIADACLHQGLSLGCSRLQGKIVTCAGHGWRYDVTTGSTLQSPGYAVATYPVKVENGKILVAIGQP
jgi:3-phenylpropionate/trans-cinnamate dioxygenase ferredoxin subunit